jgi:TRAP-type C4-dicarboxylate transport system permease small subunit
MGQGALGQGGGGVTALLRAIDRGLAAVACLLLVLLFATVLAGVVTRAAGAPLTWTDEGARFLMVWLACCGWILAGRRRAHVRIRYFQGLLPPGMFRGVEIAIQLAMALLGAVVAGYAVTLVRRNAGLDATSLPIAMAWLYVPLIPAGVAMSLQALGQVREPGAAGAFRPEAGEAAE